MIGAPPQKRRTAGPVAAVWAAVPGVPPVRRHGPLVATLRRPTSRSRHVRGERRPQDGTSERFEPVLQLGASGFCSRPARPLGCRRPRTPLACCRRWMRSTPRVGSCQTHPCRRRRRRSRSVWAPGEAADDRGPRPRRPRMPSLHRAQERAALGGAPRRCSTCVARSSISCSRPWWGRRGARSCVCATTRACRQATRSSARVRPPRRRSRRWGRIVASGSSRRARRLVERLRLQRGLGKRARRRAVRTAPRPGPPGEHVERARTGAAGTPISPVSPAPSVVDAV